MDATKLVVGQKVCIKSGPLEDGGPYCGLVTVVEVSPEGVVIVRIDIGGSGLSSEDGLMRFGSDGVACDSSDLGYTGPTSWADGIPCSFDCGLPWKLDDNDPASFLEAQERSRLNNIEHSAMLRRKYEERKVLYEQAAQASQGRGATNITGLPNFLTHEELVLAQRMWKESEDDYAKRIAKHIVEPNIARINATLGQDNSPLYLAYVAEYIMRKDPSGWY